MAEDCIGYPLQLESYFTSFHTDMTVAAVARNRKSHLVVMTGAAGFAFFHLRHGDRAIFPSYNFTVMTVTAGKACF